MAIERDMKLLTASDVAELCEVDLKTIHNWVERGCIPHFRTPGRHLRFQAVDVAKFLREWGYAIPKRFYMQVAQALVVVGGKEAAAQVARVAGPTAAVHTVDDLYAALLHIGCEPTSAVVIDAAVVKDQAEMIESALAAIARAFSTMPLVLLGEDKTGLAGRHALTVVPEGDSKALRSALNRESEEQEASPPSSETGRARRGARAQKTP
jgi:excisionase family DNA binding protein